ncbi:GTP-binding protein [Thalassotalea sp. G20_0]
MKKKISTNLITGFLGSGKTTAILHLLRQSKS